MITPGQATGNTNVSVDLTKVPLITGLVGTLNTTLGGLTRIVDTVTSTAGLSFDTSALYENLNLLSSVMTIDQGAWSQTATLSPDGTMIIVDLDKGLGPILANNIINILQNLKQAVNNLNVTVTGSDPLGTLRVVADSLNNTILAPIKITLTTAIDGVLTPVLNDAGILTQQLLDVSLLGSTTVNVPTTINIPTTSTIQGTVTSKFVGTIVQSDILDVSLFSGSDSSSNIYWNGLAVLPTAPVISNVTGNSQSGYVVTGTADPGNTVKIIDPATGQEIGSGLADSSGNYSITLAAGSIGANADINATATDAAGNVSVPTAGKTPADSGDTTAPDAPAISSVTGNSTDGYTVTGTAEAGSTVTIKDSAGTVIGSGVADGSGNYSVSLPASVGPNADITATATDTAGNESAPTAGKTPADSGDTTAPDAPAISSVTGNSADGYTVTGTAEAGSTVTIKDSTGTVIGSGVADESGNYSVSLPASVGPNADITATATDTAGNVSVPTAGKTPADSGDTTAPDAPTITNVAGNSADGYTVTGTAEAGSTVTIKDSTGTVIGSGVADGSGNYSVSLPASVGANADITVTATDTAGNESTPTAGKTPADSGDTTAPDAPAISSVTGNSTDGYTVTGTAEAGSTVTIKDSAGTVIGTDVADESGNYSVSLPASVGPNADITATATDEAGNESAPTAGKTPADSGDTTAPDAPIITNVTGNSTDGYTVTGTAEAGSTVTIKDSTGTVIGSGVADGSGNYSVSLPASVGPNADITATATDTAGNESTPTTGKTPADSGDTTAPDAPAISSVTGNSTDGYTVTGTAEAGSTVTIKDSTGTVIGSGVADGSGNYSVSLPASVGANADITVTATDEAGNVSAPTADKTPADSGDTTAPDAPAISSVTGNSTDGYTVTGTAEAGSTVTIKDSTGTVIGSGVADGSGNYSVSLPASVGPNADITVTATDMAGNESVPTAGKTPADSGDTTAPDAPIITNVTGNSTDGYTVTGTAEAGSTVTIKDSAGTVIGTAVADESGNYSVSLPASVGPNADITVTATDTAGNESAPTAGKTPADPKDVTAPDSPKVTDVTKNPDGGYNIGGTAEPGSTVTIKDGNGNVIASGKTDDSGHFHITLPAGSVKPGDLLNITATDEAGNESTASHVQIPSGTIVPVTFGGTGGQYSNGLPASYAKGVKLPATGERDNNIQTVVGFSLLAFLSLMLTKLRRKKNVL